MPIKSNEPVTELRLSNDNYVRLVQALQLYMKSPRVTDENFDEVADLYEHLKVQYRNRRSDKPSA